MIAVDPMSRSMSWILAPRSRSSWAIAFFPSDAATINGVTLFDGNSLNFKVVSESHVCRVVGLEASSRIIKRSGVVELDMACCYSSVDSAPPPIG